jgi:hypothetical protein
MWQLWQQISRRPIQICGESSCLLATPESMLSLASCSTSAVHAPLRYSTYSTVSTDRISPLYLCRIETTQFTIRPLHQFKYVLRIFLQFGVVRRMLQKFANILMWSVRHSLTYCTELGTGARYTLHSTRSRSKSHLRHVRQLRSVMSACIFFWTLLWYNTLPVQYVGT